MMGLVAPGQLISLALNTDQSLHRTGWLLLVYSDFLWRPWLKK